MPFRPAEAYHGNYQASYMAPFVNIAGAMRRQGFPYYQVGCQHATHASRVGQNRAMHSHSLCGEGLRLYTRL